MIKRLLQKFAIKYINFLEKKGYIEENDALLKRIYLLRSVGFSIKTKQRLNAINVPVPFNNVISAIKYYRELAVYINDSKILQQSHISVRYEYHYLINFFVNEKGYYVDTEQAYTELLKVLDNLFSVILKIDSNVPGYEDYINRVLEKTLYLNTKILVEQLIENI